jgi:hypothetical protein
VPNLKLVTILSKPNQAAKFAKAIVTSANYYDFATSRGNIDPEILNSNYVPLFGVLERG